MTPSVGYPGPAGTHSAAASLLLAPESIQEPYASFIAVVDAAVANEVSLGVLPDAGQLERTLNAAQRTALGNAAQVAVTLEPPGGSPSGAPTGPVLFVAALKRV